MSQREIVEIGVDLELASLTPQEIEGAYRSLCAAMLLRAAQEMTVIKQLTKQAIEARHITRAWLFQDGGLITLDEACDACDLDRKWFVTNLVDAAEQAAVRQEQYRPDPSRVYFGRRIREPAPA